MSIIDFQSKQIQQLALPQLIDTNTGSESILPAKARLAYDHSVQKVYVGNGTDWVDVGSTGGIGPAGPTGATGATGPAGPNVWTQQCYLQSVGNIGDGNVFLQSGVVVDSLEAVAGQKITKACTVNRLYFTTQNPATGGTFIATIRKNYVDTTVKATIADGNVLGVDLGNSSAFVPGDVLTVKCTMTGGLVTGQVSFEMQYTG